MAPSVAGTGGQSGGYAPGMWGAGGAGGGYGVAATRQTRLGEEEKVWHEDSSETVSVLGRPSE